MYRLSRNEQRIIEETKREGAELEKQEQADGAVRRRVRVWSMLALVAIFILLVFGIRILIGLVS